MASIEETQTELDTIETGHFADRQPVKYNEFVEQQVLYWQKKGIDWKYPNSSSSAKDDNETKDTESEDISDVKYSSEIVENLIMSVYGTCFSSAESSKFVRRLLMFGHQVVLGRLFASYEQVPQTFRKLNTFSTGTLLEYQWGAQSGAKGADPIPVNFRRVYLIFLTNYLNRIWKCYHIKLEDSKLDAQSEEYLFIKSTQQSLDDIIDSTEESTVNETKLSKSVVFQKIVDHCCSLGGAMFDAMMMKYPPIIIGDLNQLNDCISLIILQLNQLHLQIEEKWLQNENNYTKEVFKDMKGDDNFVTLVINDQSNEPDSVTVTATPSKGDTNITPTDE